MRRPWLVPVILLVLLFGARPAESASLSFASPTFSAGDSFTLSIEIQNVTDLFTFSFDVFFDPAVVSPTGATAGSFLGGCCFFAILPGDPFGVPDAVQFVSDTLVGPVTGMSGMTFEALAGGDASFALSSVVLLDSTGGLIAHEIPTAVPEPAALALLGLGLLARRRRPHRGR
jgi:MYXO-CTERM domain-containing protein